MKDDGRTTLRSSFLLQLRQGSIMQVSCRHEAQTSQQAANSGLFSVQAGEAFARCSCKPQHVEQWAERVGLKQKIERLCVSAVVQCRPAWFIWPDEPIWSDKVQA